MLILTGLMTHTMSNCDVCVRVSVLTYIKAHTSDSDEDNAREDISEILKARAIQRYQLDQWRLYEKVCITVAILLYFIQLSTLLERNS